MIVMDFCGIIVHSFFSPSPTHVMEAAHSSLRFVPSGAEPAGGDTHQEPSLGAPGTPEGVTGSHVSARRPAVPPGEQLC